MIPVTAYVHMGAVGLMRAPQQFANLGFAEGAQYTTDQTFPSDEEPLEQDVPEEENRPEQTSDVAFDVELFHNAQFLRIMDQSGGNYHRHEPSHFYSLQTSSSLLRPPRIAC
jgi:hypothetical protein